MDLKSFDKSHIDKYAQEAKERWGDTEEYKEYEKRTGPYGMDQWRAVTQSIEDCFVGFGAIKDKGPASEEAKLQAKALELYEAKEKEFPDIEQFREFERVILLKVIDKKWMDHIDDMDQLRQGVGLQAYGQRDPLVEYRMSGFDMFDEMSQNIKEETIRLLFHVRVEQKVEREQVANVTGTNKDDSVQKGPVKRDTAKVYPNDPCPCGSGKKYKQCCGRN